MNLNTKKQQQQNVQCNPTSDKKEDKRNTNLFDKPTNENISNDDKDKIYQNNDNKKTGIIIATVAGLGIVIIIVLIVILLKGGGQDTQEYNNQQFVEHQTNTEEEPTEITDTPEYTQQYNTEQDEYDNPNNTHAPNGEKEVGFQDFSGDTNRNAGNKLTDPNKVLKDVYGLSTRVDYDVSSIDTITDFVNYEKHRGTWGGGVELYWLDATYKNTPYIIQVPFKFYKELDDIGIVPVKMEVLRIPPSTNGDANERTIISYMTLDEETLENLLSGR